jgi:hypothetical protein
MWSVDDLHCFTDSGSGLYCYGEQQIEHSRFTLLLFVIPGALWQRPNMRTDSQNHSLHISVLECKLDS